MNFSGSGKKLGEMGLMGFPYPKEYGGARRCPQLCHRGGGAIQRTAVPALSPCIVRLWPILPSGMKRRKEISDSRQRVKNRRFRPHEPATQARMGVNGNCGTER